MEYISLLQSAEAVRRVGVHRGGNKHSCGGDLDTGSLYKAVFLYADLSLAIGIKP